MGFSDFANKLKEKIEKEKEAKQEEFFFDNEKLTIDKPSKQEANKRLSIINKEKEFLKKLLEMITNRATGFELAYFVEKSQKINHLLYKGVMFYNTFLNTEKKIFIDLPDKEVKSYDNFKTIEETEKYLFMQWLKDTVSEKQERVDMEKEYRKYEEKAFPNTSKLMYCKNCGANIKDEHQKFCEFCGVKLDN